MLDLERRVVDAELALEQLRQLEPGAVAVGVRLDDDVGGEGRELGGDLPDVQVVDLDDAGLLGHPPADPVGVEALRRGLEEDPAGVAQQAVGGAQHQSGDQQRGDRVGPVEAGEQDDRGGDRGADEGVEVGEQVLEAALDVEALAVGAGEDRGGGEVDDDPGQGDGEDEAAVDAGRVEEAADALERDQRRQHQQGDAVDLGGEDLDPFEPEGHRAAGGALAEADRDQREGDRGGVGEHVGGVGEQRQRVGEDPGDHLGRHEAEDQRQRDPAACRGRRRPRRRGCGRGGSGSSCLHRCHRRAQNAEWSRPPSIGIDGAGDVGGALGAEEGDQVAVLLGPAEAAGRALPRGPPLRRPPSSRRRRPAARSRSGRWRPC